MTPRQAAIRALVSILEGGDKAVAALETMMLEVAIEERGFLHELVYSCLRHFYSLEADYSRFCKSKPEPLLQAALLVGACQIRHMRVPAHAAVSETVDALWPLLPKATGYANAVLRRVSESEEPAKLKPHQRAELPKEIYASWRDAFGADVVAEFVQTLLTPPPLSLAIFGNRDVWLAKAKEQGIEARAGELSEKAVLLPSGTPVRSLPGYDEGEFAVMDQAAQAAALALSCETPDGLIIDICAAPGGKTSMLAHRFPDARIVAIERSTNRIPRLQENLRRTRCNNVEVMEADGMALPFEDNSADAIILDAPCSASGILRRHPDAKFIHDNKGIGELAKQQRKLLEEALRVLKPGGSMIYAVCSIHPEENEQVLEGIEGVTSTNRLFPSPDHDGFFFAEITKPSSNI